MNASFFIGKFKIALKYDPRIINVYSTQRGMNSQWRNYKEAEAE